MKRKVIINSFKVQDSNLSRNWWSEDGVMCLDDSIQWCLAAVSVTVTTADSGIDVPPTNCWCRWLTIASKNAPRRRSTRTRHFCVDRRELGFTINDVIVVVAGFGAWWLELLASWRGWAISLTRLGRSRTAVPATRDGHCSSSTSRITNESSLLTTHQQHQQQQISNQLI